jgi:putative ABC transport system ATP-binding protein
MSILKIENMSFAYSPNTRKVIDGLSMEFDEGKVYALEGRSGAGKTTLLSLLAALTSPTEGTITVNGENVFEKDTYAYRASDVGIVFQNYNLLPKLNAIENVELSIDISGREVPDKRRHATDILTQLGIADYDLERPVLQMSGGQQQRVAIARALSYDPPIILADEPTGNLDTKTEQEIIQIFDELAHRRNKCVIIVTHSKRVAQMADEVFSIDGMRES